MFNPDDDYNLEDMVIANVLFDDNHYFSGFSLVNAINEDLLLISPLTGGNHYLNNDDNDARLIAEN